MGQSRGFLALRQEAAGKSCEPVEITRRSPIPPWSYGSRSRQHHLFYVSYRILALKCLGRHYAAGLWPLVLDVLGA
jgi:hypothetical protein